MPLRPAIGDPSEWHAEGRGREFFTLIYPLFCSARAIVQDTFFCQFGKIEYAAIVNRLGKQSRHAECNRD